MMRFEDVIRVNGQYYDRKNGEISFDKEDLIRFLLENFDIFKNSVELNEFISEYARRNELEATDIFDENELREWALECAADEGWKDPDE